MTYETHPLEPFLPSNGRVLFLGSFPPPRARWCMEFFYPNWINDFWRIMGVVFFCNASWFIIDGEKRFDSQKIVNFCKSKGFAFFDTAKKVCRRQDNASDDHLEIVEPTDVEALLRQMPNCHDVVTTGGKASEELFRQLSLASDTPFPLPKIGEKVSLRVWGRELRWWRMPSSSRAYPLKMEKKAVYYARLFAE